MPVEKYVSSVKARYDIWRGSGGGEGEVNVVRERRKSLKGSWQDEERTKGTAYALPPRLPII